MHGNKVLKKTTPKDFYTHNLSSINLISALCFRIIIFKYGFEVEIIEHFMIISAESDSTQCQSARSQTPCYVSQSELTEKCFHKIEKQLMGSWEIFGSNRIKVRLGALLVSTEPGSALYNKAWSSLFCVYLFGPKTRVQAMEMENNQDMK